ncbi:MAG: hypothetical protein JSU87_10510, partial [Gemmatimonadota bacterium]
MSAGDDRRRIPSVDTLLQSEELADLLAARPRSLVLSA